MAQRPPSADGDQLGFAFDLTSPAAPSPGGGAEASALAERARPAVLPSLPPSRVPSRVPSLLPPRPASGDPAPDSAVARPHRAVTRGRTATRARTAVLFSRLQAMGLRGIDRLVLMRTRTVMVSVIGRTLRLHDDFADAPETVLHAIVTFATARTKAARNAAREQILQYPVDRGPAARRPDPPRPGDVALLTRLAEAHRQLNAQHFGGRLSALPLRLSGRMATRLGHYDPGSEHAPAEIVLSRRHVQKHGWKEALHTLLHEMVHQWQHETGVPIDHGPGFRRKAREVGITPAARREVAPVAPAAPRPAASRSAARPRAGGVSGWWEALW